jgi:hypothetical protein
MKQNAENNKYAFPMNHIWFHHRTGSNVTAYDWKYPQGRGKKGLNEVEALLDIATRLPMRSQQSMTYEKMGAARTITITKESIAKKASRILRSMGFSRSRVPDMKVIDGVNPNKKVMIAFRRK